MATRLKINPPTRADGNELVMYTCEECGNSTITEPFTHSKIRHREKHILVDTRYLAYYSKEAQVGHSH